MSLAHPALVVLVPLAVGAVWLLFRHAAEGGWIALPNVHRLWADRRGLSSRPAMSRRRVYRGACLAAGCAAALFALARPQWGEIAAPRYEQSREVMLALDLSRSMLADDVAPSRLARAKLLIESLLDQLKGERVGLIVFSGTAFVQSPLSADYEVLRDFLGELDPSYLPEGGTDYESMLRSAVQAFGQQGDGDRYLVVLSDGEALDEHWESVVPTLRARGIHVIGLGIGTPDGALVPDGRGGLVKDEHGAAVLSKLEPRTLQALATQTDGAYRNAATWVDVAALLNATVEQGQRGHYVEQQSVRLQDRYQWFLAPALLFFLLSYWLEFPVSPLARALPMRGRRSHPASAPAIAAALMGLAAWHTPSQALAAVSDPPPLQSDTASQPNTLAATVSDLSTRSTLGAVDYARLATDTIQFARRPDAPVDRTRSGIIGDALAAVDRGEQIDPHAADWPSLRTQLEQLAHGQAPAPQPTPPQKKQHGQASDQSQHGAQQSSSGGGAGQPQAQQSGKNGSTAPANQSQGANAADRHAGTGNEHQSGNDAAHRASDHGVGGDQQSDQQSTAPPGEVPRADSVQPLDARAAGLGGADQAPPARDERDGQSAAPAESAAGSAQPTPKAPVRMVGGGRALPAGSPQDGTVLAGALDAMERVKEGDAPAVLFDRMNRAEGQPRAEKHGKNW